MDEQHVDSINPFLTKQITTIVYLCTKVQKIFGGRSTESYTPAVRKKEIPYCKFQNRRYHTANFKIGDTILQISWTVSE